MSVTRRSFLATTALLAVSACGCGASGKDEPYPGERISYEGLSVLVPDGVEPIENESSMTISLDSEMVMINNPLDCSESDQETFAKIVLLGFSESGEMMPTSELEEGSQNGNLLYSFDYTSANGDGEVRMIFDDAQYWTVYTMKFRDGADVTATMVADAIAVE